METVAWVLVILAGAIVGSLVGCVAGYLFAPIAVRRLDKKNLSNQKTEVTAEDVAKARRNWLDAEADYQLTYKQAMADINRRIDEAKKECQMKEILKS